MRAIVTGANGMLGRNLVRLLAARTDQELTALVRTDAKAGFLRYLACEGLTDQVRVIEGELSTGGAPAAEFGDADHVFHLAGKSDWTLRPEDTARAAGLDCQLAVAAAALAVACGARRLHAPSLLWSGAAPPPIVQVKRAEEQTLLGAPLDARIYRLPILAGRADTGEADANGAMNGLHAVLRLLACQLPASLGLTLPVDGALQVLPSDVAAATMIALADAELPEAVVTIADPHPTPLLEVANELSRAAGGPTFAARQRASGSNESASPAPSERNPGDQVLGEHILRGLLARAGCPVAMLDWIRQPLTPADPRIAAALEQAAVSFPAWASYGGRGYRYWQYALDPQR